MPKDLRFRGKQPGEAADDARQSWVQRAVSERVGQWHTVSRSGQLTQWGRRWANNGQGGIESQGWVIHQQLAYVSIICSGTFML